MGFGTFSVVISRGFKIMFLGYSKGSVIPNVVTNGRLKASESWFFFDP